MSFIPRKDIEVAEIITRRHLDMLDPYKFDRLFEKALPHHETQQEAYESLEAEFTEVWQHRRYASFGAYYRCWLRRVKARMGECEPSSDDPQTDKPYI